MWSSESLDTLSMAAEDPMATKVLNTELLGIDLARMAQPSIDPRTNIVEWYTLINSNDYLTYLWNKRHIPMGSPNVQRSVV